MSLTRIATFFSFIGFGLFSFLSAASAQMGQPADGQLGLQEPATPVMERMIAFHDFLLWIITAIVVFVLALLLWIIVRYNSKANKEAKSFSHNTLLEVIWTAGPIVILFVIGIYSLPLLWYEERLPEADMTIKVTGYQWYWGYEYPDHGSFYFEANMDRSEDAEPRLLATDADVVVPVDTTVRVLVTAADVLHAWAVPSFGLKMDAVPGRINETWFHATEEGMFYGQCSELCGHSHAFMPISVRVVSQEEFDAWVTEQRAAAGLPPMEDEDTRELAAASVQ